MSDARLPERVYTEKEMTAILRRASEMQGRAAYGAEGLTLGEIQSIAAEAGINTDHVLRAARLLDEHVDQDRDEAETGIFGARTTYHAERVIVGEVSREDMAPLVRTIRRVMDKQGTLAEVIDSLEWQHKDSGDSTHVTVTPRSDRTRIEVLSNRGETAGLIFLFTELGALLSAFMLAVTVEPGILGTIAVLGTGGAAGFLGGRTWWKLYARRWR
ncbi:MAG: hypothetical protein ACREMQ_10405, partial [Longimicrobiales bacterium]